MNMTVSGRLRQLNPLNPNIKFQILICLSLYVFNRSRGENWLKCQLDSPFCDHVLNSPDLCVL